MKVQRLIYSIAGAVLLLVAFLVVSCPVAAQTPYPPVRIAEPGGDCVSGPFIDPDEDGHYRFSLERTTEGCCTSSYWHYCEWPRGEVPSYTAHVEITMHSDATSFAAVGEVGVPYQVSPLYCRVGQNQGVYDKVCTESYTRTTGIDNYDTHPAGFQLNGPSYGEIDIWLDGWTYEIITQTNYCPDGTELISDVVTLELGETWTSGDVLTEWDYIQARYTISNPMPAGQQRLYGTAYFNDSTYVWSPDLYPHPVTSFTIPSAFRYNSDPNGPTVATSLLNTGYDFDILSVCLVPYTQTILPQNCHLDNYSFADGTTGWTVLDGLYEWLESEEDGAVSLESVGLASQVVTLTGSFKMQVRARASGSSASFQFGGYELDFPFESEAITETATADYQIFETYVYLNGQSNISIHSNSDDTIIDWVCLSGSDTGGVPWQFPIPDCTFPTFDDHPDFAITEIGNWIAWLAQKFGELIAWLVCEIFVIMFTIANAILAAIRAIGDFTGIPDFPAFPDEITFDSVLEWFRQCFVSFFSWLGMNFNRLRDAIPVVAEWFWSLLLAVLGWVAEKLLLPAVTWLMQHVLEALGIGEDAMEIARAVWRDLSIFVAASALEAGYEFESLTLLLTETAGVFGVLITGFRGVATGSSELDFGESLGGLAAYLWRGVEFINESVSLTPLSALNIVALGVITVGLAQWTISRLLKMLERLS